MPGAVEQILLVPGTPAARKVIQCPAVQKPKTLLRVAALTALRCWQDRSGLVSEPVDGGVQEYSPDAFATMSGRLLHGDGQG